MTKRLRVYPSSAAFMWGSIVHTEYASGCLRKILIDANGIREPFNPIHSERGEVNEEIFEAELKQRDNVSYEREKPFREKIAGTSSVVSGRIDFNIITDGVTVPWELKSTESENQRKSRIQYGKWGLNNVAQLSIYMMIEGVDAGKLNYTFFNRTAEGVTKAKPIQRARSVYQTERTYDVKYGDGGRILVDSKPTPYTANDVLEHIYWAAKVVEDDIVWERPANFEARFGSPCSYCPFKSTCKKWDDGVLSTTGEFLDDARSELLTFHEE